MERLAPLILSGALILFGALLLYPYYADDRRPTVISLSWDGTSGRIPLDVTVLMVPEKDQDSLLSGALGDAAWREVSTLLRNRAGIALLPAGDILTVTKEGEAVVRVSLHHYLSRISGRETLLKRTSKGWRLTNRPIILSSQTMIKTFVVRDEFARDNPEFYEMIRPAMRWDWGVLHHLKPGDAVSFMVRGIFDHKILIDLSELIGFSVKSARYGDFTLLKPTGCGACEFYVTTSDFFLSPPGYFRSPLNTGRISSPFGVRDDPFNEEPTFHQGVDIKAEIGSLVHAAREGVVTETGRRRGYGNTIVIRHADGIKTLYAHLDMIYVRPGNPVGMGDVIGTVGNTGRSTGSHLHFGVYRGKAAVDPLSFTYERLWLPPFDIADTFRQGTVARAVALEESLRRNASFFLPEVYAGGEKR